MNLQAVWTEELSVKTFESDFMGRWKPAPVLQSMTEAAASHAAHLGVGYYDLVDENIVWVLSRVKIVWNAVPCQGETLRLHTWPKGLQQKLFFARDFLIDRPDGLTCIAASTAWLLVDPITRRLVLPNALKTPLPEPLGLRALDEPLEKIATNGCLSERLVRTAGYSAVDMLGHTNSARYLDWISDCFSIDDYARGFPAWLQINYSTEVKPGDQISIAAGPSPADPRVTHMLGTNLTTGARAFEAAVGWHAEQ